MKQKRLVLTVLWFLLIATPAAADDQLNVVFIISDDLSAQSLGCYGNAQCKSPNIDHLATQSARFTHAYCQYPVCGPSRAALMSGMYAQAIGVTSNGHSERFAANLGKRPSMSQHFINHGYHAARVSKIYHMRVPGDITAGVNGPDHAASWTERSQMVFPRCRFGAPACAAHEAVYCLRGRNDHLLRTDRWALIRYGGGGIELYDMQTDPRQFTNLATDPKHKQTLTDLHAKFDAKLKAIDTPDDSTD